jgi:hypothetical protein
MFEQINELSILVAAILAVAVGYIWYSPILFGQPWMKSIGLVLPEGGPSKREMLSLTIRAVIVQILFFMFISQFVVLALSGAIPLLRAGALVTLLVVVFLIYASIWERRSLSYVLIHAGYTALTVFGGMGIIAYWPW